MGRRTAGRLGRALVLSALLFIVAGALGIPSAQAAPAPGGNNGTVKIEGGDIDGGHDNDPHVGCTFKVEWFGFDVGERTSTVTFDGQPPTGGGELLVDNVTFTGNGSGNTLDHFEEYDLGPYLVGITPHPQQGWHVKLTVETDGSKGADKKHKTFWVNGCQGPSVDVAECTGPGDTNGITLTIKNNDIEQDITIDQDGTPQVVHFGAGETKEIDLPHTAATTITVTDSNKHEVVKNIGAPDCTKDPVLGSITLEKDTNGTEAPADTSAFGFTISCGDGSAVLDKTGSFTLTPADGAQTVASGVPTNTSCTITETDDLGATSSSFTVDGFAAGTSTTVTVDITDTSAVAVVMTNTFDPTGCTENCGGGCVSNCEPTTETLGKLTLDKVTSGNNIPANDPSFSFSVSCTDSGATVVGSPSIKASDAPLLVASNLSINTSCTVTETGDQGATDVSWTVNGQDEGTSSHSVTAHIASGGTVAVAAHNDFTEEVPPPVIPPEVQGNTVTPPPDQVLGVEIVRPALARTGFNTGRLVVSGLCMLIVGLALLGWSKRAAAISVGSMLIIDAPVEQPRIPRTLRRKSL